MITSIENITRTDSTIKFLYLLALVGIFLETNTEISWDLGSLLTPYENIHWTQKSSLRIKDGRKYDNAYCTHWGKSLHGDFPNEAHLHISNFTSEEKVLAHSSPEFKKVFSRWEQFVWSRYCNTRSKTTQLHKQVMAKIGGCDKDKICKQQISQRITFFNFLAFSANSKAAHLMYYIAQCETGICMKNIQLHSHSTNDLFKYKSS